MNRKDLIRFFKNWTLPIAIATGSVLYLLFAYVPILDPAATAMAPFFDAILPLFMFFILYVTFCKVDFHKMKPVGWHLWVALFQMVFVAILMGIILTYRLEGSELVLMEALLCCVVAPCAAAAPVVTQKLGGNLEQMTTYTFLSNFITALAIPLCFPLVEKDADMTFWSAFLLILHKVCMVLVLPMLLAYVTKHALHSLHKRIISVKDLSYYLWAVSLAIVTGTTVKNICHAQTTVALLLTIGLLGLVFCIVQFAVGRWIGHYSGRIVEAGQALGQKNTAFAIWIAYTYLNPLSSVGPGCYILWQNIINSVEIWQHRRQEQLQA
ncbi:MAG: transporter [Prevotella sp.]|nr:transporter [Prevotella sp.]